jgi:tRNA (guanine-N7-)-methyltransferase
VIVVRRSAFSDRLLEFPAFVFSDGREFHHRGRWREHFKNTGRNACAPQELILDIGCNDGGLLATVAANHPTMAFIGIDWKPRALHAAAQRIAAANLSNVALLHARAQAIGRLVADGELDEIWLFHPEPLDTPRELKNRLIAEPFLRDVHHVLRPGGSLILKTDHGGYFDAVLELLQSMTDRFETTLISRDFWNDSVAQSAVADRPFAGEMTAFESRFVRKRKPIYFVTIRRG